MNANFQSNLALVETPAAAYREDDGATMAGAVERLGPSGPPLGAIPRVAYRQATTTLSPGDVLVIFTDGVTEAVDVSDQEFGEGRLEQILRSNGTETAGALCDRIVSAVRTFEAGAPQNDDITLVVARAR